MIHRATLDFWEQYRKLPTEIRLRAEKQFALLKSDPQHPSLQFKEIGEQNSKDIWSARVTLSYRALAIRLPDRHLWFWIGNHETYDKLLS